MKRNYKLFLGIFILIAITGIAGIFVQLFDFSAKYTSALEKLCNLQEKVNQLSFKLFQNESKLFNYDLLKFKSFSLASKYPLFSDIVESVYTVSKQYNMNPTLVLGIIQVESNFNPSAVSSRGAYGLMQINHQVWKNELLIDKKKIFEIDYNIHLGLNILNRYLKISKGNLNQALHYYNNGFKYNNTKYPSLVTNTSFLKSSELSLSLAQ
jgi:soluble lytic murein transglycosylase-like protein